MDADAASVMHLGRIATALEGILAIMSGKVAISTNDLSDIARTGMPAFTPESSGTRHTMTDGANTYVREDIGGGRWFRYRVGARGDILDAQVEMPTGERISVDL